MRAPYITIPGNQNTFPIEKAVSRSLNFSETGKLIPLKPNSRMDREPMTAVETKIPAEMVSKNELRRKWMGEEEGGEDGKLHLMT